MDNDPDNIILRSARARLIRDSYNSEPTTQAGPATRSNPAITRKMSNINWKKLNTTQCQKFAKVYYDNHTYEESVDHLKRFKEDPGLHNNCLTDYKDKLEELINKGRDASLGGTLQLKETEGGGMKKSRNRSSKKRRKRTKQRKPSLKKSKRKKTKRKKSKRKKTKRRRN